MIHYVQLFFGFIIGQFLMMSLNVYDFQKKKDIAYRNALKAYATAEIGYFVIAGLGLIALLFILSDYIDLSVTKNDLKSLESLDWKQKLQLYFKTGSLFLGAFIQYLTFKFRSVGKKAIDNAINSIQ